MPLSRVGIEPSTTQTYLPEYVSTACASAASACLPEPAINVSWYSSEMMFRIKSPRSGCEGRRSVSVQPVQSWKCNQITGGRITFPSPAATSSGVFLSVIARQEGAAADATAHQALIDGFESFCGSNEAAEHEPP